MLSSSGRKLRRGRYGGGEGWTWRKSVGALMWGFFVLVVLPLYMFSLRLRE